MTWSHQWCCDRIIALYERAGLEPDMGSRLFGAFVRAGLPATMRSLLPMFERLDVATAEEVDVDPLEARMREEAIAGTSSLVLPMFVAAWARTPA